MSVVCYLTFIIYFSFYNACLGVFIIKNKIFRGLWPQYTTISKIPHGSIDETEITNGNINESEITNGNINETEITHGNINETEITDGNINETEIRIGNINETV